MKENEKIYSPGTLFLLTAPFSQVLVLGPGLVPDIPSHLVLLYKGGQRDIIRVATHFLQRMEKSETASVIYPDVC